MTLEEAIKNREDCLKYLEGIGRKASPECMEAVRWSVKALKALRPVSREQVEKVRHGRWIKHEGYDECSECHAKSIFGYNYCHNCGASMTDEAVEMVLERMEALKDGKGD